MPHLTAVLQDFHEKHGSYESCFTNTAGFLHYDKASWSISKHAPRSRDKLDYYNDLAKEIVNCEDIQRIPCPPAFAQRFNRVWIKAREPHGVDPQRAITSESKENTPIFFKSTHPLYGTLSNFYPSLIFIKYKQMENLSKMYFSAETAYVTATIALYANKVPEENESFLRNAIHASLLCDSLQAKQEGKRLRKLYLESGILPPSTDQRIAVMNNVLKKKFSQNATIMGRLRATVNRTLVEHTDNNFWGDGSKGGDIQGEGLNKLGILLMSIRNGSPEEQIASSGHGQGFVVEGSNSSKEQSPSFTGEVSNPTAAHKIIRSAEAIIPEQPGISSSIQPDSPKKIIGKK